MNEFYKSLIQKAETKKDKDSVKRESSLLEIKDERTIPKLRVKFKRKISRKWKAKRRYGIN